MIRGLLPDNMYEYVKKMYDWYEPNTIPYVMRLTVFDEKPTPQGQLLFDSYFDLQERTPNDLQRFFVKLGEKIPSGKYEDEVRQTLPEDGERCPSFEILADAIVDVLDDVSQERLNHPNMPPRDHPFYQSHSADSSLLGDEYASFRQSIIDLQVAFAFQRVLHSGKKSPLMKYTFKGDYLPSEKRSLEEWEETRPKRPPPQRYR